MITRPVWPGYAHSPDLPPPLAHVHPAHRGGLPGRSGGLAGGAVVLVGIPSTPGPGGYGYLGMDITDAASWPRPYNPQQTAARFVRWGQ